MHFSVRQQSLGMDENGLRCSREAMFDICMSVCLLYPSTNPRCKMRRCAIAPSRLQPALRWPPFKNASHATTVRFAASLRGYECSGCESRVLHYFVCEFLKQNGGKDATTIQPFVLNTCNRFKREARASSIRGRPVLRAAHVVATECSPSFVLKRSAVNDNSDVCRAEPCASVEAPPTSPALSRILGGIGRFVGSFSLKTVLR